MSHKDVDLVYDYLQSSHDILIAESCDTAFNPTCNGFKPRNLNFHCNFKQVINVATRNIAYWI